MGGGRGGGGGQRAVGESTGTRDLLQAPPESNMVARSFRWSRSPSVYSQEVNVFKCSLTSHHASVTHVMHQDASVN